MLRPATRAQGCETPASSSDSAPAEALRAVAAAPVEGDVLPGVRDAVPARRAAGLRDCARRRRLVQDLARPGASESTADAATSADHVVPERLARHLNGRPGDPRALARQRRPGGNGTSQD